jgi:hypothetical protein
MKPVTAPLHDTINLRSPSVLTALAGAALAVGAGWIAGHGGHGAALLAAPIVAAALFVVLGHTTQAAFAAVVVAASTFSSVYALPRAAHLYPAEMLLLLGLGTLALSNYRRFGGKIGILLLVLLVAVFSGVEVARMKGIPTLAAIDEARPVALYAAFWIALAALRANPRRFFAVAAAAHGAFDRPVCLPESSCVSHRRRERGHA